MKAILVTFLFVLLLGMYLWAADTTEVAVQKDDNLIVVQEEAEYDLFIDKDGDGICDDRTLRNKGVFSQHQKIHHYRMISYKYDHKFRCEFGSSKDGKKGQGGNGHTGGSGGHHGGK